LNGVDDLLQRQGRCPRRHKLLLIGVRGIDRLVWGRKRAVSSNALLRVWGQVQVFAELASVANQLISASRLLGPKARFGSNGQIGRKRVERPLDGGKCAKVAAESIIVHGTLATPQCSQLFLDTHPMCPSFFVIKLCSQLLSGDRAGPVGSWNASSGR
jgi:hypothetical protein